MSLMRAAPWALAAISRGSRPSMASTLVLARTTTALLNLETQISERQRLWQPEPPKLSLILAGTLGAVLYAEEPGADCAPKKRPTAAGPKPAAKKAAGPALTTIEQALQPEKTYNVEKLLASRLVGGAKQYLVRWEGFNEKHDTREPMENLSNLVEEMAAFDLAKQKANEDHLRQLAADKAARQKAREEAGTSGAAGPSGSPKRERNSAIARAHAG